MAKKITIWVMGILVGLGLIYCGYGVFINFKFVHVSTQTDISDEDEDYLLMQTKSSLPPTILASSRRMPT